MEQKNIEVLLEKKCLVLNYFASFSVKNSGAKKNIEVLLEKKMFSLKLFCFIFSKNIVEQKHRS